MHLPKNILIFGVSGEYGRFWRRFFKDRGYNVRGVERNTKIASRKRLVAWADVIIFSVPSWNTVRVIEEVLPFSEKRQLWINTASIQTPGIEALKRSHAEYASFRVMGSVPTDKTLKDRKVAVCSEEGLESYEKWFSFILHDTEAKLVRVDSEKLDRFTQVITLLNRLALLVQATAIASFGLDPKEFLTLGTTLFDDQFGTVSRFLLQNDDLDASLLGGEEAVVPMKILLQSCLHLQCVLTENEGEGVKDLKKYLRGYFGERVLKEAVRRKYGKKK
ncbi:MAG: hypothetical protein WC629_02985 [Candidatus Paceibacterota bacterium]|jgi:prephenate dehydrogenase